MLVKQTKPWVLRCLCLDLEHRPRLSGADPVLLSDPQHFLARLESGGERMDGPRCAQCLIYLGGRREREVSCHECFLLKISLPLELCEEL